MSLSWLKNLAGFSLTDKEFEDIPNAVVELYIHVTYKTVQLGTYFGSMFTPTLMILKRPRSFELFKRRFVKGGLVGAVIGLAAGPVMTYGRGRNFTYDEYYDRAFRIRHNRNQVLIDRFTTVGALGAVFGAPGFVVGVDSALVLANAYNYAMKEPKKVGNDLVDDKPGKSNDST